MAKQFVSEPVDVGHGFTVEFSFSKAGLVCAWAPDVPPADLQPVVFDRYKDALDRFVAARLCRFVGTTGPVTTRLRNVAK